MNGFKNSALGKLAKTDLHHLSVFMTVAEAGGFSAAQVILNVGQSTISRHMAELEGRLGVRLCKRGRGGFSLTDKGQAVYKSCQKLFGALDHFRTEIGDLRGRLVGELRLGVIDNWVFDSLNPLPRVLRKFKTMCDEINITVKTLPPDEIESAVLEGRLQLGIGVFHQLRTGLAYRALYSDQMWLYCGKGHRFYGHDPDTLTLEMVKQADFIRRSYLSENEIVPLAEFVHSSATANQMESVALLILSGDYIGFLPQSFAAIWESKKQMQRLLPQSIFHNIHFTTIIKKQRNYPPLLRAFLKMLEKENRSHSRSSRRHRPSPLKLIRL